MTKLVLLSSLANAIGVLATELHEACVRAELRDVMTIVRTQPHLLDVLDEHGLTALMLAAQRGLDVIAKNLLDAGASINIRGFRQMTALHHAAIQRRRLVVVLLLERNANPNMQMDDGKTPLHYAATCCPEVVQSLVAHGANANMATPRCTTPLHMALMSLLANAAKQHSATAGLRDQLLLIVGELISVGAHTGLRTLTASTASPRGVSAREMISKAEIPDSFLREQLDEIVRTWPPAPPMPCTELARKVVFTSSRPKEREEPAASTTDPLTEEGGWKVLFTGGVSVVPLGLLMLLVVCLLLCRLLCWRRAKGGKAKKSASATKLGKHGNAVRGGGKPTARANQRRESGAESRVAKTQSTGCKMRRQHSASQRGRDDNVNASLSSTCSWQVAEGSQGGSGCITTAANNTTDDENNGEDGCEEALDSGGWEGVGDKARAKNEERRIRRGQQRSHESPDRQMSNGTRRGVIPNGSTSRKASGMGPSAALSPRGERLSQRTASF